MTQIRAVPSENDIVERLRVVHFFSDSVMAARMLGDELAIDIMRSERKEAADEIERLRRVVSFKRRVDRVTGDVAQAAPEPIDYGMELLRWSNIEIALRKAFPVLDATGPEIDNWPELIGALAAKPPAALEDRTHDFEEAGFDTCRYCGERKAHKDHSAQPQGAPETVKVSIKTMALSDGSADYYVALTVGKREITPYKFKEEWQAQYEADSFRWLFLGAPKPDLLAYGPTDTLAVTRPHRSTPRE